MADLAIKTALDALAQDYVARANAERAGGGSIKIDERFPTVAIVLSDGSEYYFQDWQADDLLAEHAPAAADLDISLDDYILAMAQNW